MSLEESLEHAKLVSDAKALQSYLLSLVAVLTVDAEQQCDRPTVPSPFSDLSSVVLGRIFVYLDWKDCARVMSVCSAFYTVINARWFHVQMFRLREIQSESRNYAVSETVEEGEIVHIEDFSHLTKEEILKETKKSNAVIAYLVEKFASQKRRNEVVETEVERTRKELRIQQQISKKALNRVMRLEQVHGPVRDSSSRSQLALETDHRIETLQITALQGELDRCEGMKQQLQRHKKLLSSELKRLRVFLESKTTECEAHANVFAKIQSYFLAMHAPRIEAMTPDVNCS